MAKVLNGNVLVRDASGSNVVLEEGSEVPSWAKDQVGDHLLTGKDSSSRSSGGGSGSGQGGGQGGGGGGTPAGNQGNQSGQGNPPPKSGQGSGREAWAAYAAEQGVVVEADDTRDEIVAKCEAANVPTGD